MKTKIEPCVRCGFPTVKAANCGPCQSEAVAVKAASFGIDPKTWKRQWTLVPRREKAA